MTIAPVVELCSFEASSGASGFTIPVATDVPAGSMGVLAITLSAGMVVSTLADTKGNAYDVIATTNGGNQNAAIALVPITTALKAGVDSLSMTCSGVTKAEVAGEAYSGISSTTPVESTVIVGGSASAASATGNVTLTPALPTTELFASVGTASASATAVADQIGNYTQRVWSGSNALLDDLTNAGIVAMSGRFAWTGTGKWAVAAAALRASGGSTTDTPSGTMKLSGVAASNSKVAHDAPSGAMTLGGGDSSRILFTVAVVGRLSFGGVADQTRVGRDGLPASSSLGGATVEQDHGHDAPSGVMAVRGELTGSHTVADLQTGALRFAGTETDHWGTPSGNHDTPSGTLSLAPKDKRIRQNYVRFASPSFPDTDGGERERDQLAISQRASRQAFRGGLEARMGGDPVAAARLFEAWQPLVELGEDMQTAPVEEVDSIVRNQDVNDQ